jgi:signal peptidase I
VSAKRAAKIAPRRALESVGPDVGRATEEESAEPYEEPARESELTFGQHVVAFFKELAGVVVAAVLVASLVRGFVGQMFLIPSESMEDTLHVNDRVLVEKLSSIKRGQIVVFRDPGGWLTGVKPEGRGPIGKAFQFIGVLPDTSTEHLIKRVIGLPGDHVVCCDDQGRVVVNDQPLDETSYLPSSNGSPTKPSTIRFDVVVPADRVFVMGDNRDHSRDSRCHLNDVQAGARKGDNAFVPKDLVVGRAMAVVWPPGHAGGLQGPATFDQLPAGKIPAPVTGEIDAGSEASC